jgi:predicted ATPase
VIQSVEFLRRFCCFEPGVKFSFQRGVNLLVGDQGSGKSSLLGSIQSSSRSSKNPVLKIVLGERGVQVISFDFEKDNPRVRSMTFEGDVSFRLKTSWVSHGESVKSLLSGLIPAVQGRQRKHSDLTPLVLLDEPDIGLSIRSCYRVIGVLNRLEEIGAQVLCAIHNPTVISAFPRVLSLEDRIWMEPSEFIEGQRSLGPVL